MNYPAPIDTANNPRYPESTEGRWKGSGTGDGGPGEVIVRDGSRIDGDGDGLRWPCWDASGDKAQQETPAVRLAGVLPGRSVGWWERVGSVGPLPEGRSGWEWNCLQPGQGAAELVFPRPALRKMQGEAARRAGEPSSERRSAAGGSWWWPPVPPDRFALPGGPGYGPSPAPPAKRRWRRSGPRGDG